MGMLIVWAVLAGVILIAMVMTVVLYLRRRRSARKLQTAVQFIVKDSNSTP